jgi:hypothetical protein
MKYEKMLWVAACLMFLVSPAYAGNVPEFDAVDCDSTNYFAQNAFIPYGLVIQNTTAYGQPVQKYSSLGESFSATGGALYMDPCFPGYQSVLTDAWNPSTYTWRIRLQMKPESDLDLNIYACVLKHNAAWIFPGMGAVWVAAEQTGRYRSNAGQLMFIPTANPTLTVRASAGQYNSFSSFTLDARTMPGLSNIPLQSALFTQKALWEESIVVAMPETGTSNALGDPVFFLKQGDQLTIEIEIPVGHPADIYMGKDSVLVKYIGIVGTWYLSSFQCDPS